jgi:hypothetical protein
MSDELWGAGTEHSRFRVLFSVTKSGSGCDLKEPVTRRRNLGRFFSFSDAMLIVAHCHPACSPQYGLFRVIVIVSCIRELTREHAQKR